MNKQFLCERHRLLALNNPEQSKKLCCKLSAMARGQIASELWNEAVPLYGTAFETADILLGSDTCKKTATTRYLRAAMEFIYALRKSNYAADIAALVTLAEHRLGDMHEPQPLATLLCPLRDVAFAPLEEVDYWIELLFAMDESQHQTTH